MERHREEVLNVYLAECLREQGAHAAGEQIEISHSKRALPDVLVTYMGLRCIIEGKFKDHPQAQSDVRANAISRVETGIAHIALGVLYPMRLRTVEQSQVKDELARAQLEFCICTERNYLEPAWQEGNARSLLDLIRRGHADLLEDDVVERSAARLREGMTELVQLLDSEPVSAERIAERVGVSLRAEESEDSDDE